MLTDPPLHREKLPDRSRFPAERAASLSTGTVQVSGFAGRTAPDTSELAQQEPDAPPGESSAHRRRVRDQRVQQAPGRPQLQRWIEIGGDGEREEFHRQQDAHCGVAGLSRRRQERLPRHQSTDQRGRSNV